MSAETVKVASKLPNQTEIPRGNTAPGRIVRQVIDRLLEPHCDGICKTTVSKWCGVSCPHSPFYQCTLQPGHLGAHIACSATNCNITYWYDSD